LGNYAGRVYISVSVYDTKEFRVGQNEHILPVLLEAYTNLAMAVTIPIKADLSVMEKLLFPNKKGEVSSALS
jgi:hypothetical protein